MTKAYKLFILSILQNKIDDVRLPGMISMPKINIRNDDNFFGDSTQHCFNSSYNCRRGNRKNYLF